MLLDVVRMRFSLTDSELSDGFASNDSPGSVLFDFMKSDHPRLLFELEEPVPVPGAVRTAGERFWHVIEPLLHTQRVSCNSCSLGSAGSARAPNSAIAPAIRLPSPITV